MEMIKKVYNPKDIEQMLYEHWENSGFFKPKYRGNQDSFCIMLPPPNITGSLHIGHAFQQTLIDIVIRYQRMQGKKTLLHVGTDHAGIATQIIMEKKIAEDENKTRQDYDRDTFIDKIWQWKIEAHNTITSQMRRIGNSADWDNERFTMDNGLSQAVKEVFIRLYKEDLIYRGKRLVNWDPKLCTAISDLEVESQETTGRIWNIRYPLAENKKNKEGKNYIVVSTTRPETLFGDTGVAVNPNDFRYQHLIGKFVYLPFIHRRIPIIADEYSDMSKGTGCVKITPAHDFNDHIVGYRHQLPMINIFTPTGSIRKNLEIFDTYGNVSSVYSSEVPEEFQGLDRFAARKKVVSFLDNLGLLESVNLHKISLPYSNRSGTIIEPMLTDQWYVRVEKLAKPAVESIENGSIKFIPKQYKNMYLSWMSNIQDWCISRQLWWGHRIPAWYDEKGKVYVGYNEEKIRKEYDIDPNMILYQDEDVLDTWFSSSLWTFSALGWPENTSILRQFHPTNVIFSGFDIIFFWIARMIMMTMHFIKDDQGRPQVPFKVAYITGLVRDFEGKKMSKSEGNIIDPLDIIEGISLRELIKKRTSNMIQPRLAEKIKKHTEKQFPNGIQPYGADALRLTLAALSTTSRDVYLDIQRLEGYRNFCNKLWNASRFVLIHTKNKNCGFNGEKRILSVTDHWILTKFNKAISSYRRALDNYRFDIAVKILYEFTWDQFCSWYLEFTKITIQNGSEAVTCGTRYTLITVLEGLLRLAHPIIPFITEAIWQHVKKIANLKEDTIMLQLFPKSNTLWMYKKDYIEIEWLKKIIIAIRNIRTELNIVPEKLLNLLFRNCSNTVKHRINIHQDLLKKVAKLKNITIILNNEKSPVSIIKIIEDTELLIPIEDNIDKKSELKRLIKEIKKIEKDIQHIQSKLENKNFICYAPEKIVSQERVRIISLFKKREKIIEQQKFIASLS